MIKEKLRRAWQEPVHADFFDARARFNVRTLRRAYENFNEFRLFLDNKKNIHGRLFIEIGCATGELYRYLNHYYPEFNYQGYDISKPAIERAIRKYPEGHFSVCKPDLSDVSTAKLEPAVVWARDVVLHQTDPFEYLSKLLNLSKEVTILRLRTRDRGTTVLDPELSCQLHYNNWVPYIVLNIDEAIETIKKSISLKKIIIMKNYVQLGGWHNRYLPKECYYKETGTAETAVYILRSEKDNNNPEIIISNRKESSEVYPPWMQNILSLLRRIVSRTMG